MSSSKWFNHSNPKTWEVAEQEVLEHLAEEQGVALTQMAAPISPPTGGDGGPVDFVLPDFTEIVRAGMDLLDKINPGWQETLDLTTLDLEDDQQCVLGQSWPHYAEMHGLINNGDYKQFADAVLSPGGSGGERNILAASIGCAIPTKVMAYINAFGLKKTEEEYGYDPVVLNACNSQDLVKDPDLRAPIAFCNHVTEVAMKKCWEHLTRTWVTEINKAKEEGRWAPANVSDGEATAVSPSESPVTVS